MRELSIANRTENTGNVTRFLYTLLCFLVARTKQQAYVFLVGRTNSTEESKIAHSDDF